MAISESLLDNAPWPLARQAYRLMRLEWFSIPRPDGQYVVADADVDTHRATLGRLGFAPNWELSYHKKGEDLNLARVVYDDGPEDVRWWQDHVRGWALEGGRTALRCHWEPEPSEHPVEHLRASLQDHAAGMQSLRGVLSGAGVSHEVLDSSAIEF